jgi:hypothetical protein
VNLRMTGLSRQPGRCIANKWIKKVSPPSKVGETINNQLNFDPKFRFPLVILPLNLFQTSDVDGLGRQGLFHPVDIPVIKNQFADIHHVDRALEAVNNVPSLFNKQGIG